MQIWLVVLIGLAGGVAVGLQSPMAGAVGQRLGGIASSFIIHLSGMVFSGLFLILRGGEKIIVAGPVTIRQRPLLLAFARGKHV